MKTCPVCQSQYKPNSNHQTYCSPACKRKAIWARKAANMTLSKQINAAEAERARPLSDYERATVAGMLLGDGSLIKTPWGARLSFCHGDAQKDYLRWKRDLLRRLFPSQAPRSHERNGHIQWHWHSIHHPGLAKLREFIYPGGKKTVTNEWLDLAAQGGLQSLAFWYCDDGSFSSAPSSRQIFLATEGFGEEGNELLKEWLQRRYGFPATVVHYSSATTFSKTRKQRVRLVINREPAVEFLNQLSPFIPWCMRYKIPAQAVFPAD